MLTQTAEVTATGRVIVTAQKAQVQRKLVLTIYLGFRVLRQDLVNIGIFFMWRCGVKIWPLAF